MGLAGFGYVVLIGTVVGSGIWTTLMRRNPAGVVAPFFLLVPVAGMSAAFLMLHERPTPVEVLGGLVVVGGVLLGSTQRSAATGSSSSSWWVMRFLTTRLMTKPATTATAKPGRCAAKPAGRR